MEILPVAFAPAQFLREVRAEVAKVTWPSRKENADHHGAGLRDGRRRGRVLLRGRPDGRTRGAHAVRRVSLIQGFRLWPSAGTSCMSIQASKRRSPKQVKEQAARKGLADLVDDVLVPAEEVVELKRGQKVQGRAQVLPRLCAGEDGDETDDTWHLIKDTPKVTGFLGSKTKPQAISEAEGRPHHQAIRRGRGASPARPCCSRSASRCVWRTGPFTSFNGTVEEIDEEKGPREGFGLDLRALHAGGSGVRTGRKRSSVS